MAPEDILLTWNPRVSMWNGEHWEEVSWAFTHRVVLPAPTECFYSVIEDGTFNQPEVP